MSKTGERWAFAITTDALTFGLLYAATALGSEPALVAFKAILWTVAVLGILAGIVVSSETVAKFPERTVSYILWHYSTSVAVAIWTALAGMPALAAAWAISFMITEAKRVCAS